MKFDRRWALGGMGEVYLARDTRLDRTVAVKILPAHLSSSLEAKQVPPFTSASPRVNPHTA